MKPRSLVNVETGEIIEDVVRIVTGKQDKELKRRYKMSEENKEFVSEHGGFIFKEDSKKVDKLEGKMSSADITKSILLATYLDFDGYLKLDGGKKMTKQEVKSTIAVQDRIFYQWYNSMVALKIIIEADDGFKMNSNYCLKGSIAKSKDYNRIFIRGVRTIYENNIGKNQTTIGHVFRLLPFVNSHNNILCWNATEEDVEKLEPITLDDIMKEIGIDSKNKRNFMSSISKIRLANNQPIMIFMTDDDEMRHTILRINPLLTYSGKNEKYKEQLLVFELFAKISGWGNSVGENKNKRLMGHGS